MAIRTDPRYGYKYGWAEGDDGWANDFNTNFELLMWTIHREVQARNLTTPPGSPTIGQCWIPASGAVDAWLDEDNNLAIWWQGPADASPDWYFVTMDADTAGMQAYDSGADQLIVWNGTSWVMYHDLSP